MISLRPFVGLRRWVDGRGRWSRLLLALVLGGLSGCVFQPLSFLPLLAVSLVGLLWIVHSSPSRRSAAFAGWVFGTSHFLVGLYWIGNAFMVHAARHAMLAVPAVVAMAAVLGVYIAVVVWIYRRLVPGSSVTAGSVLVFSSLWVGMEWVRGWAFTGFPWNLIGNMWTVSDAMVQTAALGGVYTLSLLTVAIFSMPAILGSQTRHPYPTILCGLIVLGLMYGGGLYRLSGADNNTVPDVRLRLVQPNIPQNQKWARDLRGAHVAAQLEASLLMDKMGMDNTGAGNTDQPPTHIIWAETAVPYVLSNEPDLVKLIARAVPENGLLITGSLRAGAKPTDGGRPPVWNSLFVIGGDGNILDTYDKSHLVPFGEYVPFRDILPIAKLTAGAGSFATGQGRRRISLDGLPPFSPLICYEIIFPGRVIAGDQPRPSWILNITNDAWYGKSDGPYQHFAMARLRAVEEGLPVVRVANTGISGVIDGYGRRVAELALGQAGTLDSDLPVALPATLYARWGNSVPLGLIILTLIGGVFINRRGL
ncbi:MAG: apolipoprotein N-acyltransferase [Rhodospirillales bacterium]|nr:apolipoprotein N-acyltransferase [Rhodospirillales bacterium]MBT4038511.1 apolipoprotein N-acyltransferase [Rhodospirillales bacterium]MBT4625423.1 apolipoprotein N-acyltransferase [Rhodospirillales bacterium]MBT5352061.1 apolipoprotein N-acyltransferase [Rhodospirillales bacterium]MBT5521830.1 apolipoprotein N-acyltransferase [Rhodospirillales bacterium]